MRQNRNLKHIAALEDGAPSRPRHAATATGVLKMRISTLVVAALAAALAGAFLAEGAPTAPADRPETAHREPAWRHPQAYPRPSPDRVYAAPLTS